MIYITGDCHADWKKLTGWDSEITRNDYVIVCGDFGIWHNTKDEQRRLHELSEQNITILFIDGNHENFDRLYSDEFPVVDFHGGKAHKLRDNIYHLMRGYVFTLDGKKIFAFGGASSHDIQDGILEPSNYATQAELLHEFYKLTDNNQMVRINHISWWKQEMPSDEELEFGLRTLEANDYKVDYIVSHCAPQNIAAMYSGGKYKIDKLTQYFDKVDERTSFKKWFFGHYHGDKLITNKHRLLYHDVIPMYREDER